MKQDRLLPDPIEKWMDIPKFKNSYQVSTYGQVKSLQRVIYIDGIRARIHKERILKQGLTTSGYCHVTLYTDGKGKTYTVHTLMAMAFLNHVPQKGLNVDHINNIKDDNRICNIQIITSRENSSKDAKSAYPLGVGIDKRQKTKQFTSQIRLKGKSIWLGLYATPEEASEAYQNKLKEITS